MSLRDTLVRIASSSLPGFTLVELAVSVTIMTMILGITLSGGPEVSTRLSLADEVYKTELLIREAQLQGGAVNSLGGVYGGVGTLFDLATSSQVFKFKDRVDPLIIHSIGIGNGLYEASPVDEKDTTLVLSKKNKIGKLCIATGAGPFVCNTSFSPNIKNLTISFIRPKQNAHIFVNGDNSVEYDAACIQFDTVKSPAPGYVKSILIYKTGMITKKMGICN